MANAPAWARALVDEVMTEAGLDPASLSSPGAAAHGSKARQAGAGSGASAS